MSTPPVPVPIRKSTKDLERGAYVTVTDCGDGEVKEKRDYEKSDYEAERRMKGRSTYRQSALYKSMSHGDHQHHRFYKPTSNRSWVLFLFLVAVGLCIIMLEVAVRFHLPATAVPDLGPRESYNSKHRRAEFWVRDDENLILESQEMAKLLSTISTAVTAALDPTTTPSAGVTVTTSSANPDDQVTVKGIKTNQPEEPNQVNSESEMTLTTNTEPLQSKYQGDMLTISVAVPTIEPLKITTASSREILIVTTAPAAPVVVVSTPQSAPTVPASTPAPQPVAVVNTPNPEPARVVSTSEQADPVAVVNNVATDPTTLKTPGGPAESQVMSITTKSSAAAAAAVIAITSNAAPSTPVANSAVPSANSANQLSLATSGTTAAAQANKQLSVSSSSAAKAVTLAGVASVVSGSLVASGTAIIGTVPQAAAASVVSGSLIMSGSSVLGTVQKSAVKGTSAGAAAIGSLVLTDSAGRPTQTVAYTGDVVFTDANGKATTISYNGDIVLTDSRGVATKTLSDAVVLTNSEGKATKTMSYEDITLTDSNGVATQTLSDAIILTNSDGVATQTLSFADSVVLTDSNGVATKTVLYTGLASQTPTGIVDANNLVADARSHFNKNSYFMAIYLPTIIGVVLQAAWLIVFAAFKIMEPFYRLTSKGGASAESTLLADYLSTGLSSSILKTASEGHWVLILVGLVQLVFGIAMLFVSGTMDVKPTQYCPMPNSTATQPCGPVWVVHVETVRIVELCLIAGFSMIIMIIVLNQRRVSGVYSDPSRISTMADVLVHKPLIHELRDVPPRATKADVAHDLRDNRYMLGTFVDNGREQYGIMKLNVEPTAEKTLAKQSGVKSTYRRLNARLSHLMERTNDVLPFMPDLLCMAMAIILFSVVLTYYLIPGSNKTNSFNNWMNSGETSAGIFLSAIGVIMGFLVKRKERYSRLSHSYVVLGKGPTLASSAVTAGTHITPFDSVYKAAFNGNTTLALLSLCAILTDVILILAPGIPYRTSQTTDVFRNSTYMVCVFTAFILVVMGGVTFCEWRCDHRYADCPETLAAVLIRLCASRFVDEKNVLEMGPHRGAVDADHDELQRIRYEGLDGRRKYTYGVMEGLDGVQRRMVEEDVHASSRGMRS